MGREPRCRTPGGQRNEPPRYVLGTAPGPGVSLFIASGAFLTAVVWVPGHIASALPTVARGVMALCLVVIAFAFNTITAAGVVSALNTDG
ncbi:hypothetical protein ACWF76_00445 [Streptomyces globisporus]